MVRASMQRRWLACVAGSCTGATGRVVMTPDHLLDSRWAASSWGFTLTADCFEPDVFQRFITSHRAHGAEPYCNAGVDVGKPP